MKQLIFFLLLIASILPANAQIGYQIALLNTATGEPRANVTVNADITITNSAGGMVYNTTQQVTTNDFGVMALTVGNANTFEKVDWSKLPLYISVSVDGVLIGKSQILHVPVAEYAKKSGTALTKEMIVGKWVNKFTGTFIEGEEGVIRKTSSSSIYTFNMDGSGTYTSTYPETFGFSWSILNDKIIMYSPIIAPQNAIEYKNTPDYHVSTFLYDPNKDIIFSTLTETTAYIRE